MRTAVIVALTLLLIALLPMWPDAEPTGLQVVLTGLAALVLVAIVYAVVHRPHHWPR